MFVLMTLKNITDDIEKVDWVPQGASSGETGAE